MCEEISSIDRSRRRRWCHSELVEAVSMVRPLVNLVLDVCVMALQDDCIGRYRHESMLMNVLPFDLVAEKDVTVM